MDYQKLDPRAIRMWRVSRLILLIFLLALFIAVTVFLAAETGGLGGFIPLILIFGLILALQLANTLIYPVIEYRQWAYLITPDRIEIKKGIIFHSTRIIPISRIQHVTIAEGPLARHYQLARVTIHTAGGTQPIEGLARETAQDISEKLKNVVNRKASYQPGMTES